MRRKTVGELNIGDWIVWVGADGGRARVCRPYTEGYVLIAWTTGGTPHATELRWMRTDEVNMAEGQT